MQATKKKLEHTCLVSTDVNFLTLDLEACRLHDQLCLTFTGLCVIVRDKDGDGVVWYRVKLCPVAGRCWRWYDRLIVF